MSELLTIQGKVSAAVTELIRRYRNDEPVPDVAIIVSASLRAVEDVKTAHRGKDHVAKFSMGTAILATGEEGEELLERLAEARREAEDAASKQGNLASTVKGGEDEYSNLNHKQARELCKERKLNARGSLLELVTRLRDNDPQ